MRDAHSIRLLVKTVMITLIIVYERKYSFLANDFVLLTIRWLLPMCVFMYKIVWSRNDAR